LNILVCDDDKEILNAIEIYLVNEGYKVLKATNGVEALEIIEENEIHLIIMDIMMPKMDGLRATMKIREDKNIFKVFKGHFILRLIKFKLGILNLHQSRKE